MVAIEGKFSIKKCAFCKYWYDPLNSAISPKGTLGVWEYDPNIEKKCRRWNQVRIANSMCDKFEYKL